MGFLVALLKAGQQNLGAPTKCRGAGQFLSPALIFSIKLNASSKTTNANVILARPGIVDAAFLVLLLLLCFFLYSESLKGEFLLDDWYVIVQNTNIKHPELYSQIFTGGFFDAFKAKSDFSLHYYRPVVFLSFALDYQIWGLNPFGYRLVNVFVHALNGFLLYRLLLLLFKKRNVAMLSSIFFCILPIQEVTVNHIVGRCDLLQAFFMLLCLINLVGYLEKGSLKKLVASNLCFILALLSREAAIVYWLFIALVTFLVTREKRKILLVLLSFTAIDGIYLLLRAIYFPITQAADVMAGVSFPHLILWLSRYIEYCAHFLFPWTLQVALGEFVLPKAWLKALFGIVTLLLFVAAIVLCKRKDLPYRREIQFSLGWLIVGTVPFYFLMDVIVWLGTYMSEYVLYFSAIGFVILLSCLLLNLNRVIQKPMMVAAVLYFIFLTAYATFFWHSEQQILERAFHDEKSYELISGQQLLMKYRDDTEAIQAIVAKSNKSTTKALWLKRLGNIYRQRGDVAKAEEYLREAIALNPKYAEAYDELAVIYLERGDTAQGLEYLYQSLAVNSKSSQAHRILGIVLYRQGNYPQAAAHFKETVYYDPDNLESLMYLGMSCLLNRDSVGYERALEAIFKKGFPTVRVVRFMAQELFHHGFFAQTAYLIEGARGLLANDVEMMTLLNNAYMNSGKKEKADPVTGQIGGILSTQEGKP